MSERLHEFTEGVKEYGKAVGKTGQLKVIDIASRALGMFLLWLTIILLLFAVLCFCSVAAISALGAYMPIWAAALVMVGVHILLIGILYAKRQALFVRPFLRLMSGGTVQTERDLEIETLKAEHTKEMCEANLFTRLAVEVVDRIFGLVERIVAGQWTKDERQKTKEDGSDEAVS